MPDEGTDLPKTDKSSLALADFQIPQGVKNLSFDVNFLTNELTPTFTNDFFTAALIAPNDTIEIKRTDTFAKFTDATGTRYKKQTGFSRIAADVSQFAGSAAKFSLKFEIADFIDDRRESAVSIDNIKLTPLLDSIAVVIPDPSMGIRAVQQLAANGIFNDGAAKDIKGEVAWSSSRPGVAPMNAAGQVLALAKGTSEITASKDNITSPGALLTVTDPQVVAITIAPPQKQS